MEDQIKEVIFFMNSNNEFIYVDNNYTVIKNYGYDGCSPENTPNLVNQLKNCKKIEHLDNHVLHYYQPQKTGIAHSVAKLSTYLQIVLKYHRHGRVVIPNNVNPNIIDLITNVFQNFIVLQSNIKYVFSNFIFSAYIELMNEPKIMKPHNKYPLVVYNNEIYWFRSYINKYIDFKMEKKKIFDKVFIGKFEGQGDTGGTKPRSVLGCVSKTLLDRIEKNGFKNIDPYKHHIHDVIYYLRNATEVILSIGTCSHLYAPYINKNSKLYILTNVLTDQGIDFDNLDPAYNTRHGISQCFFPQNTKICFYNYAPHYDKRVFENSCYKGKDMLEFLST